MFNLGFGEMLVIAVIALIFIGPKQLPEVAAKVGRLLNELKRTTNDLTNSFVNARDSADQYLRETRQEVVSGIEESPPHPPLPDEYSAAVEPEGVQLSLELTADSTDVAEAHSAEADTSSKKEPDGTGSHS